MLLNRISYLILDFYLFYAFLPPHVYNVVLFVFLIRDILGFLVCLGAILSIAQRLLLKGGGCRKTEVIESSAAHVPGKLLPAVPAVVLAMNSNILESKRT